MQAAVNGQKLMGRLLMKIVIISDEMKKVLLKKLSEKINDKTDRTLTEAMTRIKEIRESKKLNDGTSLMDSLERYLKEKKRSGSNRNGY